MAAQGKAIPIEGWWLRLARNLVRQDQRPLEVLGHDLAKAYGRVVPWTHGVLSRFAAGKGGATLELAQALCLMYSRLPPPVIFPRTYEEAIEMMAVTERYDSFVPVDGAEGSVVNMQGRRPRRATGATIVSSKRRKHG